MTAEQVEMPERIVKLERDHRGYPVPYIVLRLEGKPVFTANNILLVKKAVDERLCHVCGESLEEWVWFTGGPGSVLLNGDVAAYNDGPMHQECMRYAMQACPHLSHRLTKAVGGVAERLRPAVYVHDPTTIPGIPALFVNVQTARFSVERGRFIVPKPFRKIEYWQHGELLPLDVGRKAAKRAAYSIRERLPTGEPS